ncbi:hypothetical protein [Demequina sp. NBRC 110051]|uniref:PGAP1-like alpha/beta domain-containing protein n=1 Tax=Demequina sp. NBRC 110051 TaxID=1570340 RepID=UPI000A0003F6|nr:hypothetical protein [Demequina sp. NBRC 110051]
MSDPVPVGVAGGAGGTQAVTEDLEAAARVVDDAAAALDDVATRLARAADLLAEALPRAGPSVAGALARADGVIGMARWDVGGAGALSREVDDVAARLVAVAEAYARAEDAARGGVGVVESVGRFVGDAVATVGWLARARALVGWRASVPGAVAAVAGEDPVGAALTPDALPPMTGYVNRGTVGAVTGTLDATGPPWLRHYDRIVIALRGAMTGLEAVFEDRLAGAQPAGPAHPSEVPRRMEALATSIDSLSYADTGVVAIDQLTGEDSHDRYVVTIPGTYDNSVTSINPFDWRSNLDLQDGAVADSLRFTVDSMEAMRIPRDAEVMLVGHSQGGMVATALAGLDGIEERFTITDVVTFGSPVADLPHRDGVTYAHVEDVSDTVPALDKGGRDEAANVTTWSGDARASGDHAIAAAALGPISLHAMRTYRATASAIDKLNDPSTAAWRDGVRGYTQSVSARRREFRPAPVSPAPARPANVSPDRRP